MKTKRKLIRVTQEHINKGKQYGSTTCPIALAVNEQLPVSEELRNSRTNVLVSNVTITYRQHEYTYVSDPLPIRARKFIKHFDRNTTKHLAKPFNFYLKIGVL